MTATTIAETISEIQAALREYVEATYHVGHPSLVAQRHALLEQEGVLFRAPYIESTPRYRAGQAFGELDLPATATSFLHRLAHPDDESQHRLLFDPPYTHQASALEATVRDGMSLVITTGTGSGKTESFLLPILAKLALEAEQRPASFAEPAVRALLLYPMNALVNDQLGRLRLLFGDARVSSQFQEWSGRPARFARYTSRTLYPGVRTTKKDSKHLRSIETFYIRLLEEAADPNNPQRPRAEALVKSLQDRGKWPSKPDLRAWFGASGTHWKRRGEFVRAVTRPDDVELLTRHEVLEAPPDILVTNYSMLEYMLMRPLERPVFEATRRWLEENPDERLMLVVDEAHLYRGAAGAEVALLLRRLRARLGIPAERLHVICTSASFNDPEYARTFAAQLSGKSSADFKTITGELAQRPSAATGSIDDAEALAAVPLQAFYDAEDETNRLGAIRELLEYRSVGGSADASGPALHAALQDFPPMSELINKTMSEAMPLAELGAMLFPAADAETADRAATALVALGSAAHRVTGEPGLLPCRIHAVFRGLPGLWACLDPTCSGGEGGDSPIGAMYSQPRSSCQHCQARVFELYTCRNCGAAYARAYTDDVYSPRYLWPEPGNEFMSVTGFVPQLFPIDLLLEEPTTAAEPAELDLVTGGLNPMRLGDRTRTVYLRHDRDTGSTGDDDEGAAEASGEFIPCGVCGTSAGYGRTSVQDHQTKGDQPFQALVSRQIEVQPPGTEPYSDFAPLRGRKVLTFSDSRQTAARLAPNLQTYSLRDVLRPVILRGWRTLSAIDLLTPSLNLDDLYLAVLVGSTELSVRLRPELRGTETMRALEEVREALHRDALADPAELFQLRAIGGPPQSLLRGMVMTVTDRYYGLGSLALASLRERRNLQSQLAALPPLSGVAESDEERLALARLWITQWSGSTAGVWFEHMTASWLQDARPIKPHSGKFSAITKRLPDAATRRSFEREWLPILVKTFCEAQGSNKYKVLASRLALDLSDGWGYCHRCRTTQRPFPGSTRCANCGRDEARVIDPSSDLVFNARKGYYRGTSVRALGPQSEQPMAIIAAEHTAQLNASQSDAVFSKAEEHELLFQEVRIARAAPG